MSTNGIDVCEDTEMADCDGDKVVTMMDVLKEQEDFEEDANAVLGASDDKNCTYSRGYVKRQAIYACMTCCTDAKTDPAKRAGVCLACSLTCHENHELIELYTKRNFRCDCGNPKFNSHPCQFTPDKTDLNIENVYNQNFTGVYCICHRPYPDIESSTEGDMIQCIICEDWLHFNHLDAVVPSSEQYSEMICKACMDKNNFLHDYADLVVNKEDMDGDILNNTTELTENKHNENANSNSDDIANVQTENDANIEDASNEDEVKKEEHSGNKSEPPEEKEDKEEQESIETSEANEAVTQRNSNQENVRKMEMDKRIEAEQKNKIPPEQITTSTGKSETLDYRSPEQEEEDLLLADPMDTDLNQKEDIMDVAPSNGIQYNTDDLMNKKKPESEAMKISTEASKDVIADKLNSVATVQELKRVVGKEESENVITSEQSENVTPIEQTKVATSTEQLVGVSTTEYSESGQVKNAITTNSEGLSTVDQSKTTPMSEQPESDPERDITKVSETDKSESISKIECSDKNYNSEKDVSLNENSTTIDKDNKSHESKNSTEFVMDENNTDINSKSDKLPDTILETDILKRKLSSDEEFENVEVKKLRLDDKCVRPRGVKKVYHGATFWPCNFRHSLCTCNECLTMYKDLSVLFLIDPDDTVTAYEKLGKEKTEGKPASQYEKGMAALSSLGRVQQINALTEYTKLRDKLLDFLKSFKDKKVIVKEEDIKAFFAGMKPVREPDGVYFCR